MTRIGIYGGTFSPPHNGHIAAAKAFMEQMWLDILYVIPAATPPHKQMTCAISPEDRLNMCRLAFSEMEGVYVSDMEIQRGGKSYTVDTLRELTGEDRRLFLLLGTDMMLSLGEWYRPDEIFRLSYPVYIRREKDAILDQRIIQTIADYNEKYGKVVRRIVTEPLVISSSEIRRRFEARESVEGLLPPSVEKYIRDKHLYG
ncbi:MAG: nicotinate (nicotinamide) nucleotide adenylyltransferase [Clostridia bacterium]|nr:nicotinate (nicotinamide) nucleotide adenylyltransferase [Clostridia bacterium]MBQ5772126.1 nicotinate (nicotinamide) nucleotide adenylyltransferase [Clostridia bacterium]